MEQQLIFDVDGTLTPSRGKIDPDLEKLLLMIAETNKIYFATGSDYPKTLEQLGETLCHTAHKVYNCSGNDVWQKGKNIHTNPWIIPEDARRFLIDKFNESPWPMSYRYGNHIEQRPGMVNFSILGRSQHTNHNEYRINYINYDCEFGERQKIAAEFNEKFPALEARVAGEIGIDISPKGNDKSQIAKEFFKDDSIIFFGDRMEKSGNDYPLAVELQKNYVNSRLYYVCDWRNTLRILQSLFD